MSRDHVGPETVTLANYRQRLRAVQDRPGSAGGARRRALAGGVRRPRARRQLGRRDTGESRSRASSSTRAAALQAYYENMPLRRSAVPDGIRHAAVPPRAAGVRLATFHMLDTRQYRDDQACGDGSGRLSRSRIDPIRSITGPEQERWLLDGFRRSHAALGRAGAAGVLLAAGPQLPGRAAASILDAWDGYVGNRDRIIAGLKDSPVRNAVVLTGDVHVALGRRGSGALPRREVADGGHRTGHRRRSPAAVTGARPAPKPLTCCGRTRTSASSNNRRGYVRCVITPEQLRADFRVLPYVSRPDAPVQTAASFVVVDRRAGAPTGRLTREAV